MTSASWRPALLNWYRANRRDLPWRRTQDPYAIWVSEVMLQQTQVATVIPYFDRWLARFPTVGALAKANEEEVLSLWQGLGYYRRAKLLRVGAQWVAVHGWPQNLKAWLAVPGIGPYTAAAIGSIAQGLPAAVVDGNVERVFARFTASDTTGPALLKAARQWAQDVLDSVNAGDWNQSLMELGAMVCTPRNPKCDACPIAGHCVARQTWSVGRFPIAEVKPTIVREVHKVWVPYFEGRFGLRQIPEGQWWAGMWEFPRAVRSDAEDTLATAVGDGWRESLGNLRHQVTHHRITIEAWLVRCESTSPDLDWRSPEELSILPLPSPQRKVLRLALTALGLPIPATPPHLST